MRIVGLKLYLTIFLVALAAALLPPDRAQAQHWVTKEFCEVTDPQVSYDGIGQTTLVQIKQEAANTENGVGRLWKIAAPNGAISHLWGTYHSNDQHIVNLPTEFREILKRAESVTGEVNSVADSRRQLERFNRGDLYFRQKKLAQFYDIDQRSALWAEMRLIALGFREDMLRSVTLGGLANMLFLGPCEDFAIGAFPIQDHRIALIGRDNGAKIAGFESMDTLVETLNEEDRKETALAIIEAYASYLNPKGLALSRSSTFALYLEGRIGELMAWERKYLHDFFGPEKGQRVLDLVDEYLVVERNLDFLGKMRPMLDKGDAVIAVGCFHLPGKRGLVDLLRREGYSVDRVVTEGEQP